MVFPIKRDILTDGRVKDKSLITYGEIFEIISIPRIFIYDLLANHINIEMAIKKLRRYRRYYKLFL